MTPEERDQWRQFALNELLLDSGNRAAAATVVILDTIAALQRENAELRELLNEVYEAQTAACIGNIGLGGPCGQCRWCRVRAALTPSAAPGKGE